MKNLIIGAGQLGSRHLQGLLKFTSSKQEIYVLDPSEGALNVAKERADEIQHEHTVHYVMDWKSLPHLFDLVIVATNSHVREKVVTELLKSYKVKYLVLEKVLFNELSAFERVEHLLKENNVQCWVNHPRRMIKSYQQLKDKIGDNFVGNFHVTGGNWGLACNGLHFIDFFEFLSNSKINSIDADWLNDEILESPRKGFIEFTGSIKGTLQNGSTFQISSLDGANSFVTITIFDATDRYIIQEFGTSAIYHLSQQSKFKLETAPFVSEFQSGLSTDIVSHLFMNGTCGLPTYQEARHTHEFFIRLLLEKYNKLSGKNSEILPIT